MSSPRVEQKQELSAELKLERRFARIEEDISDLKKDLDLAFRYVRAMALQNMGAKALATLEIEARLRDERIRAKAASAAEDDFYV